MWCYLNVLQPESLVDVICCQHPALGVPHELLRLLGQHWLYTINVQAGISEGLADIYQL